jgi:hypothetical protein
MNSVRQRYCGVNSAATRAAGLGSDPRTPVAAARESGMPHQHSKAMTSGMMPP